MLQGILHGMKEGDVLSKLPLLELIEKNIFATNLFDFFGT